MNEELLIWIRMLASLVSLGFAGYGIFELVVTGFSWLMLLFVVAGVRMALWLWPREAGDYEWLGWLDELLMLPLRLGFAAGKLLLQLLKAGDSL